MTWHNQTQLNISQPNLTQLDSDKLNITTDQTKIRLLQNHNIYQIHNRSTAVLWQMIMTQLFESSGNIRHTNTKTNFYKPQPQITSEKQLGSYPHYQVKLGLCFGIRSCFRKGCTSSWGHVLTLNSPCWICVKLTTV